MLNETLTALAAAGGTAIVSAASTDLWANFKTRLAALLGRDDAKKVGAVEARLDRARVDLQEATPEDVEAVRTSLSQAFSVRLLDLLEEEPEVAADLRALVDEVNASVSTIASGTVQQHVVGYDHAQQAVQGQGHQVNTFGGGTGHA
jgi:hypothetical protein